MASIVIVYFEAGFISDERAAGWTRDISREWVAERAVLAGMDMTIPPDEMAERLGHPYMAAEEQPPHPRTPGGLLVNAWVALLPPGWVLRSSLAITAVATGLLIYLSEKVAVRRIPLPAVAALLLTGPFVTMFVHRATAWVVALSILATWLLVRGGNTTLAGLTLVPAIALRIWPAIFIPYLWWRGHRRGAIAAILGAAGLNLAGLLLPGVSIEGSLFTLSTPVSAIGGHFNFSLLGALTRWGAPTVAGVGVAVVIVIAALWYSRRLPLDQAFGLLLLVAVVGAPTAWLHYRVALLPLALIYPIGWLVLAVELFAWLQLIDLGWLVAASTLLLF